MSKKGVTILYIPQKSGKRSTQIHLSYIMSALISAVLLASLTGVAFLVWESAQVPNTNALLNETLELGQQKRELDDSLHDLERRISLLEIYALQAQQQEAGGPQQLQHITSNIVLPWQPYLASPVPNAIRSKEYVHLEWGAEKSRAGNSHQGIDFFAIRGTKVQASHDGIVQGVYEDNVFGKYIILLAQNGCHSLYGHIAKSFVKEGEWIKMGAMIALVGDSGSASGAHVHFELRCEGLSINPRPYFLVP